jgi:hypothetical protein
MKAYPRQMGALILFLVLVLTPWPTCWKCGNYWQLITIGAWYVAIGNHICTTPCRMGPTDSSGFTPTWEGGSHWIWLELKQ